MIAGRVSQSPGTTPIRSLVVALLVFGGVLSGCAERGTRNPHDDWVLVSSSQEEQMGRDAARRLEENIGLYEAEPLDQYVDNVGSRVAVYSERPDLDYEFRILDTFIVNALALPGGYVYLTRGLMKRLDSEAELAGVLAHEVAHVVARHSAEQIERARAANLGLIGYTVLLGRPRGLEALGIDVGANLFFARHSREDEAEADSLAVGLLIETGWHPDGLVSFFRTMMANRDSKPGALESLFASHPLTEDRIREVERMIDGIPEARLEGLRRNSRAYAGLRTALERHPPPPEKFRVEEDE